MKLSFWNEDFLCRYRRQIRQNGYLYLRNIPPSFQWISFSQSLTRSCLISQAQTVYIRDFQKRRQNSSNITAFSWHTDGCYYPIPPRYLAVLCLEPEQNGEAIFRLADGKKLLWQRFSELEQRELMHKQLAFISKDRTQKIFAPILYCPFQTKDIIRYCADIENRLSDPWFEEVCDRIIQFCNHNHLKLYLEKHSLLIIDNHRMLHTQATFKNANHHLQRIWLGY